jgi:hypothetical protein
MRNNKPLLKASVCQNHLLAMAKHTWTFQGSTSCPGVRAEWFGVSADARTYALAIATKANPGGAVFGGTLIRQCSS